MGTVEPLDYRFCPRCGHGLEIRVVKPHEEGRPACSACGYVAYLDPRLAACTVFMHDGGIVLLKRAHEPRRGTWVFPGGFVDRGEHPEAAAAREAMEEAGVRVGLTGLSGVYNVPPSNPVVLVVYRGELIEGQPAALDESLEACLFPRAMIPWDDLAFPSTLAAVRDYVRWREDQPW
jgi:8-oxo-dGTP diphosphatase